MEDSLRSKSDATLRSQIARVLDESYELDHEIGRGGMGIVFKARDRRLKRSVAVKLLPPELAFREEIRSRFLREAETAAQLNHPHIIPIYSVDEKGGLVYFVMGYVEGMNLARRIQEQGPLPPEDVRRILCEVSDALAYAHARGVVHRDIKPDNILLDAASQQAMVTDFGIARALWERDDARITVTGMAIGTPAFMSPEQSAGERELDGRSDLYSLGVVAYQMLCGELPFHANSTPALLVKHLSERPVPIDQRASVPHDLARAVMLLLEKNPADRFQSATELKNTLESGQVPERPTPAVAPPSAAPHDGTPPAESERLPTPHEYARWNTTDVTQFRRRIALFIWVNTAFVLVKLFGGPNLLMVTAFWSIGVAYEYAKLWSEGYGWHDVFRQPRERMLGDVLSEWGENVHSLFNRRVREQVRHRHRLRASRTNPMRSPVSPVPAPAGNGGGRDSGAYAAAVRDARVDHEEILRLVQRMSRRERAQLPGVTKSSAALAETMASLAAQLEEVERTANGRSESVLVREIDALEAAADPSDVPGSEERVRRLAHLRRERRAVADVERRRETLTARLESCALALRNMRFDVLRLQAGAATVQQVTTMAEHAMQLARNVEGAVHRIDEAATLRGREATERE